MDFGLYPSMSGTILYNPAPPVPDPAVSQTRPLRLEILYSAA